MLGEFVLSTNLDTLYSNINNYMQATGQNPKVILLTGDCCGLEDIIRVNDLCVKASTLLPPLPAMSLYLDECNPNLAYEEYARYLNTEIPDEFIAMILYNSFNTKRKLGRSLTIIHFDEPSVEMGFINVFLGHILNKYGVVIDYLPSPHLYNFNTVSNITNFLYGYGLLSKDEFMSLVPKDEMNNPNVFGFNINRE